MCAPMIGAVFSAMSSIVSGMNQAAGYEAQAKLNERQAKIEKESGIYEAHVRKDAGLRLVGDQLTSFAASGLKPTQAVLADSQTEVNLDIAAGRYGAKIREDNFRYQAKIDKMNAQQAQMGGFLGALSPIMGAFGGGGGSTNIFGSSYA